MFQTYEAVFGNHSVLKSQSLNEGLNGAIRTLEQLYTGYSDGILRDIIIETQENRIRLKSGVVIYQGKLFHLDHEVEAELEPNGQQVFLKLRFQEAQIKDGMKKWTADVILDESEITRNNEMELCRFCYQAGVRLRTEYNCFQDYGVPYNVVNIIHAPYAAPKEATISPQITRAFAEEMLQGGLSDPYDIAFCFECLRQEAVSAAGIRQYLTCKLHIPIQQMTNSQVYVYLERILNNKKNTGENMQKTVIGQRRLIVD